LKTVLALVDRPRDAHVEAQLERLRASGATLRFTRTKARTVATVPLLLARHRPYLLPPGGSSPLGALGAVETALELAGQVRDGALPEPGSVVVAAGSGGTAAGLLLGLRIAGLRTRVVAVVVNDTLRLDTRSLTRLSDRADRLLRRRGAALPALPSAAEQLMVVRDWLGPGYGHATADGARAQALAADRAGLALEPVYTAKALAALLSLAERDRLPAGPALFLATDGPR
jgi:D-cysteine desulfhydrase